MALMNRGYRVLLAHPELNPGLQASHEHLDALVARGVLLQITGASLLPDPKRSRRSRLARRLLERGSAHVIASDAHSGGPWRPPVLTAALEVARSIAPARADWMVTAAPAAILGGMPLPPAVRPLRPWHPSRRRVGRRERDAGALRPGTTPHVR